jgi:ABC-type oligopeptide transport system substrate-binding subunit
MKHRRSFLGLLFAAAMSAAAVMPAAAAHAATSVATTATYYTMELSPASATVRPGHKTTTTISFSASRRLYGTAVDLSVNGLPSGVTASFSPATPRIGCTSTLTLTAAPSSAAGVFVLAVTAITESTDPIGTSTTFDLTINSR